MSYVAQSPTANAATSMAVAYDARNRAIKRVINGQTRFLYYDGWSLVQERDAAGNLIQSYVNGPATDEVLKKADANGTVYYQPDALGSTVALTDGTGSVVESYSYDIFGAPTVRDGGGNVIASSAYGNRTMFTGREWIKEVGLYDYRNRVYSAALGRFVQTDPIRFEAGDVNLYRYVQNNPVNYLDGLGLAVVKNNSGSSLTVSGNIGSGHGTSSSQSYGVVPDGATGGGNANPVRGYPTPEEAEYASDPRNYGPHRPTGTICDIDSYGSENDPSGSDGFLPHRVIGDEQGPTVTVTKDSEGSYQESETGTLGAYIRRGLEKLGY